MASDDDEIPDTGAIFTFGKTRFAENLANKFWIRDDKVLHLACGDEHSAVITSTGRLYTFGSNDWGQLGHGNNKPYTKPGVVKKLKGDKVTSVSCGRSHTLVITESGVFSFGAGADSQLGHGDNQGYNVPTRITALENETISTISCGAEHSVAITDSGKLYVWGSGSEGQLGLGIADCDLPTEVKFRSRPISVACGYYHTAVVTEDGKLFTFGDNEGGKLGLDDDQCDNTDEPQQVMGIKDRVVSVACGGSHTAVVTDRGALYTMGYGMHGQLGHGPSCQEATTPRRVAALQRKFVTAVSCGESHTAVVTRSGELFTCGDGRHGKLGMGDDSFSNLFEPTRVRRFKSFHVSLVSCGGCHMLVVAARSADDGQESDESDADETIQEPGQDEVDGPMVSPRLAASMPSTGMSARDKRRLKELENTSLGGSLPPLNRSSLPPLTSLGLSPIKKDADSKSISSNGFNPLDRSTLPTITFKDGSADEKTGTMEKANLDQSTSGRRLPPRPKKRLKKPTSASDSEEEEGARNRENSRRPKPTPRKRQEKTQDQVDGASKIKQVETEKTSRATKKKSQSRSSGEDSEYESEEGNDKGEVPTASRSLAETKKSEKISSERAKHDDSGHEDEETGNSDDEVEEVLDKGETSSKEKMVTKVEAMTKAGDNDQDDDGDDSKSEDEHDKDGGREEPKVKGKDKGKAETKVKDGESEEEEDEDEETEEESEEDGGETSKKANKDDDDDDEGRKEKNEGKKVKKENEDDGNQSNEDKREKDKGKGKKKKDKDADKTEKKSKKSTKDKKKKDGDDEESAEESGKDDKKEVERGDEGNAANENKENQADEGSSKTKDGEGEGKKDSKSGKKSKRSGVCVLF